MTDILLSVVSEAERNAFPTMSQLSENDVDNIWSNVSSFIERQMSLQKGVHIAGLGTFTFSQQKLDVGNKFVLIQRPIFLLAEKLSQSHGLKQLRPLAAAGDVPVVPLNFTALSVESPFDRDQVEGCVRETLLLLLRAISTQRSVLFTFHGIGLLSFSHSKVKMKFYRNFVTAMDGSGRLLWALSNRPGTSNSIVSGRISSLQRPGSNTIMLPRIPSGKVDKASEEEGCALPPIESDGAEGNEKETQPAAQPKSRQVLPTSKVNGISLTDNLETKPAVERCAVGSFPSEVEVQRGNSYQNLECQNHTRAGQELCYLCMQRAQRNIPLYLSEERLREEQEEERVLLLNEQQRDQQYLQREQADRQQTRENNQQVAALNLGVSEALKEKKAARSSQFHGSYIFGGRPCTPPRQPKQQRYKQELVGQAEWRKGRHTQTQQDQELIDRLHQFQLADEIALQRSHQLYQKHENAKSYQKALDTQVEAMQGKPKEKRVVFPPINRNYTPTESTEEVEYRGTGIPAREPDSDGPLFGTLDCTPSGLAEQRQRAQRVYQEQLNTANHTRKEAEFNRITEQRRERDMLHKNRKELIADRITRYEKLRNLRASLEDTWSRSADLKRRRDLEERDFIRSGSWLLIDQCEQYRRCYQCKRRAGNCGETNIWKESRYIPGSRLMV